MAFLKSLRDQDIKYISAPEIAKVLHTDPTQITKDFSCVKIVGKTKVGYETNLLIEDIEHFLGYNVCRKAFLIGIGSLGNALLNHNEFANEGLRIVAGFDIDTNKIDISINNIKISNIEKLKETYEESPAEIGIITVPTDQAQNVADVLIECGIKAIWNFSARPISAPNDTIVENTSIASSLAMIKWKLNENKPLIYKNRIL